MTHTIGLILHPLGKGRYSARLDGREIVRSRKPWVDGARKLKDEGHSPETLLTIRHVDRDYDSFMPAPIGVLTEIDFDESDRAGIRRRKWRPHPMADLRAAHGRGVVKTGDEECD